MYNCFMNSVEKTGAVVLAGGQGMRMREITNDTIAKPCVLVDNKPLIDYSIDNLPYQMVESIVFALGHHAKQLEQWIQGKDLPHTIFFADPRPSIMEAVIDGISALNTRDSAVCNADEIRLGFSLKRLLEFHRQSNRLANTVVTTTNHLYRHKPFHIDNKTGRVSRDKHESSYYYQHPEMTGLVNVGFFIFEPTAIELFDPLHSKGWNGIIEPLIDAGQLGALVDNSIAFFNVGTPKEYIEATNFFSDRHQYYRVTDRERFLHQQY